jgi:NRPS condensation-like uncharacterized protein
MPGRLNIFQRTMLQWNELHPYNAIHVARVPAVFDHKLLTRVIQSTIHRLGLSGLVLDSRNGVYSYEGGAAHFEVKVLSGPDPAKLLVSEIEQQLNTTFAYGRQFNPFRFFVVPEADAFNFGLVYFHPVADAETVVFLLKRMVEAYFASGETSFIEAVDIYPRKRDWLITRPAVLLTKLLTIPGQILRMRRSCRPHYQNPRDAGNGFILFSLPVGSLARLAQTSKSWGVTVNDLLLALLVRSLAPLAEHARTPRRSLMSVGCIVNLRRELGLEGPRTFGLFLGSFLVTVPFPDGQSLKVVTLNVHDQTEQMKRRRLYLATDLELRFARRMLGFFSTAQRKKLYQKHYPLWGGVTNMNLNPLWPQPKEGRAVDYFRAVSTGPATPLVLSVTTVREAVNIGLSFRRTVFSPADIGQIQNQLLELVCGRELAA